MLKVFLFAALLAYTYAEEPQKKAIAVVRKNKIEGTVTFAKTPEGVQITGTISGLKVGKHGFHIHEKGDVSNLACTSAGGHFNPTKKNHGSPQDSVRHVGDLGNIVANANGVATLNLVDKQITLEGPNSIIGRSIVIHADEDDLGKGGKSDSLTTGHAGQRLACAVIGIL